jgi:putative ABC transport system permease protein
VPLNFRAFHIKCDQKFLDVFSIPLVAGRNFSDEMNERHSVIVNETFVRQNGSGDPLMKRVFIEGEEKDLLIVGVIKDFHFQTLHHVIRPLILTYIEENFMTLYVRMHQENRAGTVTFVRKTVDEFNPDRILPFQDLNVRLLSAYRLEQNQWIGLLVFSTLAVLIACLGLFGLAAFTAERKTKEIGIRKVLGAQNIHLFLMLSLDFVKLSLLANLFGLPLAIYFVNRWMANFAYHIPVMPWTFLFASVLVLIVMLLTSGTQIIRITRVNPVDVLKHE